MDRLNDGSTTAGGSDGNGLETRVLWLERRVGQLEVRLGMAPGSAKSMSPVAPSAGVALADGAGSPTRLPTSEILPARPGAEIEGARETVGEEPASTAGWLLSKKIPLPSARSVQPKAVIPVHKPAVPAGEAVSAGQTFPPPVPYFAGDSSGRGSSVSGADGTLLQDGGPSSTSALSYAQAKARVPLAAGGLERVLGVKWTAWVGALVLVTGGGIGLKFAYDQGWLGGLPPSLRVMCWALLAIGLLGAGEWALRKVNRLASVGFSAAGVAGLFLVAYAGYAYYGLYSNGVAFALMAVATLVGSAVAARADLASIGVLSFLGANVAPLVMQGGGNLKGFLCYLLAVQGVALLVAGRGGGATHQRWWSLRGLSLLANIWWVIALGVKYHGVPMELTVFACVSALLSHAELGLTAMRGRLQGVPVMASQSFSAAISGLAVVTMYFGLGRATPALLVALLTVSASLAGAAVLLRRRMVGKGLVHSEGLGSLEEAFRAEALATLFVSAVVGVPAALIPVALGGLGLILATAARLHRARGAADSSDTRRPLMPQVAGLASAASILWAGAGLPQLLIAGGQDAATWAQLGTASPAFRGCLAAAAALVGAAVLTPWRRVRDALLVTGAAAMTLGLSLTVIGPGSTLAAVLLGWLLIGVAWLLCDRTWLITGAVVLATAAAKWLLLDVVGPRLDPTAASANTVMVRNVTALAGVTLAVSVIALAKLWRHAPGAADSANDGVGVSQTIVRAVGLAICLLAVVGLNEIDHGVWNNVASERAWSGPAAQMQWLLSGVWLATCSAAWLGVLRRLVSDRGASDGLIGRSAVLPSMVCAAIALTAVLGSGITRPPLANLSALSVLAATTVCWLYTFALRHPTVEAGKSGGTVAGIVGGLALIAGLGVEAARSWRVLAPDFGMVFGTPLVVLAWVIVSAVALRLLVRARLRLWVGSEALASCARGLVIAAAVGVAGFGLLIPWLLGVGMRATPIGNAQLATSFLAVAGLFLTPWMDRTFTRSVHEPRRVAKGVWAIAIGIVFASTSIEVARLIVSAGGARLAVSTGYSVWWALLAITGVIVGFATRQAVLRIAGLTLFGVTLLKVVLLDLSGAGQGWRILSFMALGLLLLVTSLLYGKLAPLILGRDATASPGRPPG